MPVVVLLLASLVSQPVPAAGTAPIHLVEMDLSRFPDKETCDRMAVEAEELFRSCRSLLDSGWYREPWYGYVDWLETRWRIWRTLRGVHCDVAAEYAPEIRRVDAWEGLRLLRELLGDEAYCGGWMPW